MTAPTPLHTGGCGCGGVRFEIDAPLLRVVVPLHPLPAAHGTAASARLRRARSESSRARTWSATVRRRGYQGVLPRVRLAPVQPEPEGVAACASRVRRGSRHPAELRQYVEYAAPWDQIPDDGLPRFGKRARPDRRPQVEH